ncbi:PglZ domain-containing protein [candidate division KSB1 bacterium]|nr:PglZ domain-containing protein [candidate division KSB1 bacterium]
MKPEIIQNFLVTQISTPPNFIFLRDNSQVLSDLSELMLYEITFRIIYYENDLQLRSELEWAKDNPTAGNFCIISQKTEAENKLILDYVNRSLCFNITPQAILNFSGTYQWSEAANWLKGDDFWRVIDALRRTQNHSELQLANPEEIYIASALLDQDVTRKFDLVSGTLFYFKTMPGNKYQRFKQNYPELAASVEKKIQNDVPALAQFKEQPNLIQQIWLKNNDSLRNFTPYQSIDDLKYQLAIKTPNFVRDQIDELEKNVFGSFEQIQNYLKQHLKRDNLTGWADYLKNENFLTEPLKIVIKRAIEYLLRNPENFDLSKFQEMVQNLSAHHLIHTYLKKSQEVTHSFIQIFIFFKSIVALYSIRKKIIDFLAHQPAHIHFLLEELYPQEISQIPLLLETIQIIEQRLTLLSETNHKKLRQQIELSQQQIHDYFVNWVASNYAFTHDWLKQINSGKTLPFQMIHAHLTQKTAPPLFVIIFDGMRWDGWELLRPIFERVFRNRQFEIQSILLPLPSITNIGRTFVLTGDIKPAAEWSAIRQALKLDQRDIFSEYPSTHPQRIVETIMQSGACLKIIHINLFDQRIHHSTLSLQSNYDEIQREFLDVYVPILERLPTDSPIIICSDHGFIQVSGKYYRSTSGIINPDEPFQHRRYLALPEIQADKKHFAYFSEEQLGLAESSVNGLAFLKDPVVFKIQPTEKFVRYAHGGISLEEQVVPVVIIN